MGEGRSKALFVRRLQIKEGKLQFCPTVRPSMVDAPLQSLAGGKLEAIVLHVLEVSRQQVGRPQNVIHGLQCNLLNTSEAGVHLVFFLSPAAHSLKYAWRRPSKRKETQVCACSASCSSWHRTGNKAIYDAHKSCTLGCMSRQTSPCCRCMYVLSLCLEISALSKGSPSVAVGNAASVSPAMFSVIRWASIHEPCHAQIGKEPGTWSCGPCLVAPDVHKT